MREVVLLSLALARGHIELLLTNPPVFLQWPVSGATVALPNTPRSWQVLNYQITITKHNNMLNVLEGQASQILT